MHRAIVRGLETGEADLDRDGFFSLDEVYEYVYGKVVDEQPEQRPTKMGYVEGKIFIGNNPRPMAAELPAELQHGLDNPLPGVRKGAVDELEKLLKASNKGLVLAADAALTFLATSDDSQEVRTKATKSLAAYPDVRSPNPAWAARQAEEALQRAEAEAQKAREEAEARERAEAKRKAWMQDIDARYKQAVKREQSYEGSEPSAAHPRDRGNELVSVVEEIPAHVAKRDVVDRLWEVGEQLRKFRVGRVLWGIGGALCFVWILYLLTAPLWDAKLAGDSTPSGILFLILLLGGLGGVFLWRAFRGDS